MYGLPPQALRSTLMATVAAPPLLQALIDAARSAS